MTTLVASEAAATEQAPARLGMWIFLSSELLLFAGLFALYAGSRALHPAAFKLGIHHADKLTGSTNTAVLLVSSTLVALGVNAAKASRKLTAIAWLTGTLACGALFLLLKLLEYRRHLLHGIAPGGHGSGLAAVAGLPQFWTLYYATTGLHAVHVVVGLVVLSVVLWKLIVAPIERSARLLENAALYWHLIDLIWIFLWPLFYLA